MVAILVDIHRPAHDHEPIEGSVVRQGLAAIQVGGGDRVAALGGPVGDAPEAFAAHVLEGMDAHVQSSTSTMRLISTATLSGREAAPRAVRECLPLSPKSSTSNSEAPLITCG